MNPNESFFNEKLETSDYKSKHRNNKSMMQSVLPTIITPKLIRLNDNLLSKISEEQKLLDSQKK